MARPNVSISLSNIGDTLRHYGYAQAYSRVAGSDVNGNLCIRFDFTAATWATTNLTVIVRALSMSVGNLAWPIAAMTPSVAPGQYSDGVFSYDVFLEDAPLSANAGANEKFMTDVLQVIRGNQMNSCNFYKTAAGTEPKINGFNGAVADVLGTYVGTLLPAGKIAPAGYGS